jgi:hypothetical protein
MASDRLHQCIRPIRGATLLALMESARLKPHKIFGHEGRFFSQADEAPVDDRAISYFSFRKTR